MLGPDRDPAGSKRLPAIAHVAPLATTGPAGVSHRPVQRLIRFDRDEEMAWARRWLQDAKDQGIDAKPNPASHYRSLQQALASMPVRAHLDNAFAFTWQCG